MFLTIATVKCVPRQDCFVDLPNAVVKQLNSGDLMSGVKQLTTDHPLLMKKDESSLVTSWSGRLTLQDDDICINEKFTIHNGIENDSKVTLEIIQEPVLPATKLCVAPLTNSDWELINLNSTNVEVSLRDQVRFVQYDMVIPYSVSTSVTIIFKVLSIEPGPFGELTDSTELHVIPPEDEKESNANTIHFHHKFSVRSISSLRSYVNVGLQQKTCFIPPYQAFLNRNLFNDKLKQSCCQNKTTFYAEIEVVKDGSQDVKDDIKIIVEVNILSEQHFAHLFADLDVHDMFVLYTHPILLEQLQSCDGNIAALSCYHKPLAKPDGIVLHYEAPNKDQEQTLTKVFKHYLTSCKALTGRDVLINQGTLLKFQMTEGSVCSVVVELMNVVNAFCGIVDIEQLAFLTCEVDNELKSTLSSKKLLECSTKTNDILLEGGLANALDKIKHLFDSTPNYSLNPLVGCQQIVLLYSSGDSISTGIGKSYILQYLQKYYQGKWSPAAVNVVDCVQLHGKKPEKVFSHFMEIYRKASFVSPCSLILLDDLDELMPFVDITHEDITRDQYVRRIVDAFKEFIESIWSCRNRIHIVATCSSLDRVHKDLLPESNVHIFNEYIELPSNFHLPIKYFLNGEWFQLSENVRCTIEISEDEMLDVEKNLEGINLRDFHLFLKHICNHKLSTIDLKERIHADIKLNFQDLMEILKDFHQSSKHNINLHKAKPISWVQIGGLTKVKNLLIETFIWPIRYHELFGKCAMKTQSGVLLYGAPGTAKTMLAGAVAHESGLNFITIKGPELLSKYVGSSESNVRDLFARAHAAAPCLLFFDELESLAPRRGHDNTGVTDRVVNQLLTQLDGVESCEGVYIIAATSRPDMIDPALLRPGRIDKSVLCALPCQSDREEILNILMNDICIGSGVDISFLAKRAEFFSGADLKALIMNAQLESMHKLMDLSIESLDESTEQLKVGMDEFMLALNYTQPSVSAKERANFDRIYSRFKPGNASDRPTPIQTQLVTLA